jgi:hypothetical protein
MTYKNTYKKFLWLIKQAKVTRERLIFSARKIYFDEMETIHHTKCKPLSIAVAVNEDYQILALQVAEMPAKGRLARFSVMKYGPRKDERDSVMGEVFRVLKTDFRGRLKIFILTPNQVIESMWREPSHKAHMRFTIEPTKSDIETACMKNSTRSALTHYLL